MHLILLSGILNQLHIGGAGTPIGLSSPCFEPMIIQFMRVEIVIGSFLCIRAFW